MPKHDQPDLPVAATKHISDAHGHAVGPNLAHLPAAAIEHMSDTAKAHLPTHPEENVIAQPTLEGATISYEFQYAEHYRTVLAAEEFTVGSGVEMPNFPGFAPYVGTLDIGNSSVTVHFSSAASFATAGFNGFMLDDFYNQAPDLTSVTLLNDGGSAALTQDDIVWEPNHVSVNLSGTSFSAGSDIVLGLTFASAADQGLLLHS